jgi:hypothetical protein
MAPARLVHSKNHKFLTLRLQTRKSVDGEIHLLPPGQANG